LYQRSFQAIDVADFLRARLRHLRARVVCLWARRTMHGGPEIETVCKSQPRLYHEEFSASAPELNPTLHIWHNFRGHTANRLLRDTRELRLRLQAHVSQVCCSQAKLCSFTLATALPSPP
jgi:hypothetical protein